MANRQRWLGDAPRRDRCDWQSIDLFIDDDTRQQYRRFACDDPRRVEFENRVWYFARTLYSMDGNDSRTEHFARKTMEMMLRDAPGITVTDSRDDDLELMLRFGWPRAWGVSMSSSRQGELLDGAAACVEAAGGDHPRRHEL